MNEIKVRLMAVLVTSLLTGFSGCLNTGCNLSVGNDGVYGFEHTTRVGFYYTAKQTTEAKATIELKAPALVEWIMGPPAPEAETALE